MPGVRLCLDEQEAIAVGLAREEPYAEIARRLGRPTSTVSREVAGRGGRGCYRATAADHCARAARRSPKEAKLISFPDFAEMVSKGLEQRWSSGQIARRLRQLHPMSRSAVSHETIYSSLYCQGWGGSKRELVSALRSGRVRRRPRKPAEQARRNQLAPMAMISERPSEAADRAVPGHWEGDLVMGAFNRSAVVTLVERHSHYLLLGDLTNGHSAEEVYACLIELIQTLPDNLARTLTWDQGPEMALHHDLAIDADIEVYFCDPHPPWKRPTNENLNRDLRQYFPKGTDVNYVSPDHLQAVAREMNGRPRIVLDGQTPAEVYAASVANDRLTLSPMLDLQVGVLRSYGRLPLKATFAHIAQRAFSYP